MRCYPPYKSMFVEYSWNIPMIYSRNIRKTFPTKFRGTFIEECSGNIEYTNIPWGMFLEYWMQEYSMNVPWISYKSYMHFFRRIKNSIVDEAVPDICWKSNKYITIANNCLTTNYNNNYTMLLSCDYVIIDSIIMYTFL